MTDKESMKLALEALKELHNTNSYWWQEVDEQTIKKIKQSITALEEALAQPEQEPVAWMWDVNNGGGYTTRDVGLYQTSIPFAKHTPLYTHPPQRTEQEQEQEPKQTIYLGDGPDWNDRFEAWWESHGQFCGAGGGSYEKIFAFRAYEAALSTPPQRKPLTEEQRQELMSKAWNKWLSRKDDGHLFAWDFSFEVEAAHNIKEKT